MASISRSKNGHRTIQFVAADGKRRSIRLGKISQRHAEEIKVKVEALNAGKISGLPIDGETASWIRKIGSDLADKLSAVGLIDKRQTALLGEFLDGYLASRDDMKAQSKYNLRVAADCLIKHFGREKPLADITAGDADEYALQLRRDGLADATIGRRIKRDRQFFRAAIRKKLITENPFEDVKAPVQTNDSRQHYVSVQTIQNTIDAAPDAQWRLIIALARFGGFRTPSETVALRWEDVNWERNRIIVHSPKTEHLPGGQFRIVPLFPELRSYLEEVFEQAQPGEEYVITRYRDAKQNLGTQFRRIIKRAGETPWPRLFHNLRASRQTDLMQTFPIHVVCSWLGNSAPIAEKHYLQVTEKDFDKAAMESAAKSGAVVVQNPVQQDDADNSTVSQGLLEVDEKEGVMRNDANRCKSLHTNTLTPTGLQLNDVTTCDDNELQLSDNSSAAKSGAVASEIEDQQLAELVRLWPSLPDAARVEILQIAQSR